MASKTIVALTASFERNLEQLETFLLEADATHAFDRLLDELMENVIPNLECFPVMGKSFFDRPTLSVETSNGIEALKAKLETIGKRGEIREYMMAQHLLLYARFETKIYLLSIRNQRQLSFDLQSLWPTLS